MIKLITKLAQIREVTPRLLSRLEKLGIITVKDLLWHFPFRYEDFSKIVKIADLQLNERVTIQGVVKQIRMRRAWRRNMLIIEAVIVDETGGIKAIWFNQPYIMTILRAGRQANFAGKVVLRDGDYYLSNPTYESTGGRTAETKHTAGLIPIYPETKGLTSKGLRYLIKPILGALEKLEDFIPEKILTDYELPDINIALKKIHFPLKISQSEQARKRFAFEDLFLLQLNNFKIRLRLAKEKAAALAILAPELEKIIKGLPFALTFSQKRSLEEILEDIQKTQPMNRLLQGDVGSGKTVVVAIAAIAAAASDKQTAFMAPTEILARQHYKTLTKTFGYLNIGIGLLTSGEARAFYGDALENEVKKSELLKQVENGSIKILVGTHALIAKRGKQKGVKFQDLALVIVDEQHRFGVDQRAALVRQENENAASETSVHFLSMSATPIPRTLSLTLFGDLDLSLITELPSGRKPIITKIVSLANRQKAYNFIREQIKKGRQAFVICPRISASENGSEFIIEKRKNLWLDVKNVTEEYERLSKKVFLDLRVAMLHGRLKSAEKEKIMADFAADKIDILVSTSVIEVGIDIPNASIMMIEGADRFGLSQLYQFRGRVGRAEHQSFCLLFTDSELPTTHKRLTSLLEAKNGFELAEKDLAIRGPGQFIGEKQTGLPDLAMKSLNDLELVRDARAAAAEIIKKDPNLKNFAPLKVRLQEFQKQIHLE